MNNEIEHAVRVLNHGGIIIFPTDTAFGIGCRIDNAQAVKKLFDIRKRAENKATPVLVSDKEMVKEWVDEIPKNCLPLLEQYWPGGLTVVLNSKNTRVPKLVKGGGDTLGVRMPDHEEVIEIIKKVGVPILGPSANFAGESTPYTLHELNPELVSLVDFVVPGKTKGRRASTVVDCTVTPFKVLREGVVHIS